MNDKNIDEKTKVTFLLNTKKLKEFDIIAKSKGLNRTSLLTILIYETIKSETKED